MDPLSIAGNTLGAGALSPRSQASSSATGGYFAGGTSSDIFGDFNVQFGGIGGAGGPGMLQLLMIGAGLFLAMRWARKS